ncbi:MAG: hypothetical protein HRT51_12915 [Colwellia sp.]|nr:hypothetical protein [Colwellia sp.]
MVINKGGKKFNPNAFKCDWLPYDHYDGVDFLLNSMALEEIITPNINERSARTTIEDLLRTRDKERGDGKKLNEWLKSIYYEQFLPIESTSWFDKKNLRLSNFLLCKLSGIYDPGVVDKFVCIGQPEENYKKIEEILLKDIINFDYKMQKLKSLQMEWSVLIQSLKNYNWITPENEIVTDWAWEYLNKKLPGFIRKIQFVSEKDKRAAIIACIDSYPCKALAEKQLFLNKMQNSKRIAEYEMKQPNKKQYNFRMHKDIQAQLDVIKDKLGQDKHQIVEELITGKYKSLMDV